MIDRSIDQSRDVPNDRVSYMHISLYNTSLQMHLPVDWLQGILRSMFFLQVENKESLISGHGQSVSNNSCSLEILACQSQPR